VSDLDEALESASPGQRALRTSAAYARTSRAVPLWLRGADAREAALKVLTSRLLLRDGQAQQALLLDETARPLADVTVCADDEDYLLVVDGLSPADLHAHLNQHLEGMDVTIEGASESHEVISVHGPFGWELLVEVLGSDLMALPYLNFFRLDEGYALRGGKTGEFGYELVVRRELADGIEQALADKGAAFDAQKLDADALSLAQFEAWFFDPQFVPEGATPLELQLQWRLSRRPFVGKTAIDGRRELHTTQPGLAQKLVCVLLSDAARPGEAVSSEGEKVGSLFRAERSEVTGLWLGSAMVSARYAHAGLDLTIAGVRARTIAPPLLDNRSLHVDPRRHGYATRDEITFGPLTRHALRHASASTAASEGGAR